MTLQDIWHPVLKFMHLQEQRNTPSHSRKGSQPRTPTVRQEQGSGSMQAVSDRLASQEAEIDMHRLEDDSPSSAPRLEQGKGSMNKKEQKRQKQDVLKASSEIQPEATTETIAGTCSKGFPQISFSNL